MDESAVFRYCYRTLVVFVDDTGHERLAPGHDVFGLGGCAVLGRDLDRLINQPWRAVRERVTGSPDKPLHAAGFSDSEKNIATVANYFRLPFFRFGTILDRTTIWPEGWTSHKVIRTVLERRIDNIVQQTTCTKVMIIFESSERADPLVEAAFQHMMFRRGIRNIAVECFFMRKSEGAPGLEVADFVMHALGRQAKSTTSTPNNFKPDYAAVFHSVEPRFTNNVIFLKSLTTGNSDSPVGG